MTAFRLQQVLEHKRRQEEAKTLELATLSAEQRRSHDDLRGLRDKEEAQLHALQESARAGAIDPRRLDSALGYLDSIEASIARQSELVSELAERVLEGRGELIAILKEKQLLEKLEQQHAADQRGVANRRENGQFDEIAAQRYIRRGVGEVS
jgi:flagellar export protein FliJ